MGRFIQRRYPLLLLIAVVFCGSFFGSRFLVPSAAQGQSDTAAKDGIMLVPVQIERELFGVAMVDTTTQTLWIYEFNSRALPYGRLSLWAARSWRYDRMLQQYNTAEPTPEQVKIILESAYQKQEQEQEEPEPNEPE